jgi:hypothetical protein
MATDAPVLEAAVTEPVARATPQRVDGGRDRRTIGRPELAPVRPRRARRPSGARALAAPVRGLAPVPLARPPSRPRPCRAREVSPAAADLLGRHAEQVGEFGVVVVRKRGELVAWDQRFASEAFGALR